VVEISSRKGAALTKTATKETEDARDQRLG